MHFWIDKRSQPCIGRTFGPCIGRNRVLAGSGFGFNHQRRIRSKAMVSGKNFLFVFHSLHPATKNKIPNDFF